MLKFHFIIILFAVINLTYAQSNLNVVSTSMFEPIRQEVVLESMEGWLFKQGNDTLWANPQLNTTGWKPMKPTEINTGMADDNGRVEGWFRIKIKLDSSFNGITPGIRIGRWTAIDLYVDGKKIKSYGNTGELTYAEHPAIFEKPTEVKLLPGNIHVIALHLVDYVSPLHFRKLKSEVGDKVLNQLIRITGEDSLLHSVRYVQEVTNYTSAWISVMVLLSFLFWLLYFQNSDQGNLLLIAVYATGIALNVLLLAKAESRGGISFGTYSLFYYVSNFTGRLSGALIPILLARIFNRSVNNWLIGIVVLIGLMDVVDVIFLNQQFALYILTVLICVCGYYIISSWKGLKGAQWYVVMGLVSILIFSLLYMKDYSTYKTSIFPKALLYGSFIYLSLPVFLMIYVASRFREIISDVRKHAKHVLQLSEEKREQAIKQKDLLESEVARQTVELRSSLETLKATQSQLIQSEKMASLGELTSGIAHEIQNPLNFVNNFSEVSKELIAEMKEELVVGSLQSAVEIADDISQNLEKINHHGKRADAIVKGMLQHSRTSTGQKEPADINALCEEYLRLAYHGMKAKDNTFNVGFNTEFDPNLGLVSVVTQDFGRVLLNLINNAFYAVHEKVKSETANVKGETADVRDAPSHVSPFTSHYQPLVTVSTKNLGDKVEVMVKDNGNGIPDAIKEKIFQPFFTTKPTGQGTGLGLSLSYDIVKAHGGVLKVETNEEAGSSFIILLPAL
jgi:two-component system, NtrC family, sensor kinase